MTQAPNPAQPGLRQTPSSNQDRALDKDQDRERREPGLNTDGRGDAGADPAAAEGDENSNT